MLQKRNKQYAEGGKWWESLFNNLGGILQGAGSIVGAAKGNPTLGDVNLYGSNPNPEPQKSNAGLYIIIGVILIAVVTGAIMLIRKK